MWGWWRTLCASFALPSAARYTSRVRRTANLRPGCRSLRDGSMMRGGGRGLPATAACAVVVCVALLTPTTAVAGMRGARVRWQSTGDPLVAGYRVHVRVLSADYGLALDAGMGTADADGAMLYGVNGSESAFSNEVMLPARPACTDGPLTVSRFAYRAAGRRKRLVAQGAFAAARFVDPTTDGATVEIADADGRVLYSAAAPAAAFRRSRSGHTFRYVARGSAPNGAAGLLRLVFHVGGAIANVSLRAKSSDLPPPGDRPRLTWRLRLGNQCVAEPGLACSPRAGRVAS